MRPKLSEAEIDKKLDPLRQALEAYKSTRSAVAADRAAEPGDAAELQDRQPVPLERPPFIRLAEFGGDDCDYGAYATGWMPDQYGRWAYGEYFTEDDGQLVVQLSEVSGLPAGELLWAQLPTLLRRNGDVLALTVEVVGVNDPASVVKPLALGLQAGWQVVPLAVYDDDGPEQARLAPNQSGSERFGRYRTDADGVLSVQLDPDRFMPMTREQKWTGIFSGLKSADGTVLRFLISVHGQDDASSPPADAGRAVDASAVPASDAVQAPIRVLESEGCFVSNGAQSPDWMANQSGRWTHGWYGTDAQGRLRLDIDPDLVAPLPEGEVCRGKLVGLKCQDGSVRELPIEIVGCNDRAAMIGSVDLHESDGWQLIAPEVRDMDGVRQSCLMPGQGGEWAYGRFVTDDAGQLLVWVQPEHMPALPQGERLHSRIEGLKSLDGSLLLPLGVTINGSNDPAMIDDHIVLEHDTGEHCVVLNVMDRDGEAEQSLMPHQQGVWTHGRYRTDAAGQLAVTVEQERLAPLEEGERHYLGRISGLMSMDGTRQDVAIEWAPSSPVAGTPLTLSVREEAGPQQAVLRHEADPYVAAAIRWQPGQDAGWSHGAFRTDAQGNLSVFVDRHLIGALAEGEELRGMLKALDVSGRQQTVLVQVQGGNEAASVRNPLAILEQEGWQTVACQLSDPDGVAQSRLAPDQYGHFAQGDYHVDTHGTLSIRLDLSALGPLAGGARLPIDLPGLRSLDGSALEAWAEVHGINAVAEIQSRVHATEVDGPQMIDVSVRDADGVSQSRLQPGQSGLWSHGRYQTDGEGRLSLEVDRDKLPAFAADDMPRMGMIRELKSVDGTCRLVEVEISGVNDAAQIQDRVSIEPVPGWQPVPLMVSDPDGAAQSALRANQAGAWEQGRFMTDDRGQLSVQFDDPATARQGVIKSLLSLDGSQQDVTVLVNGMSSSSMLDTYLGTEMPLLA